MKFKQYDITMILDALELLNWVIKTKQLFGLENQYQYTEDEVNSLYKKLEEN